MIEKTIELIDDEHVLFTVTVVDGERIRSRREYHLAKFAHQDAEEVCRQACPEAFAQEASFQNGGM
jgi:hypothetical protein